MGEFFDTLFEMTDIYFTTGVRWAFLILAVFILARQIRSLMLARNPSEIWAYLGCPDNTSVPLTHWENLIGRGRGCDVILNLSSVSRSHGTLIRDSEGVWKYNDLDSKNGSAINNVPITKPTIVRAGDVLTIAGADFTLYPVSLQERMANIEKRKKKTRTVSPWPSLIALTIFQFLTVAQFQISLGDDFPPTLPASYVLLCVLMWAYVIIMRIFRRVGFEMEIIAFFLSTLSLSVTASAYPTTVFKQAICICLGVALFFGLCWFLRDLNRAKRITYILMGISVFLLLFNLIFGTSKFGAANWVTIGGFSVQPSELVKIVFIYIGAATLDELQQKKNTMTFVLFSVFCLGCLAIMGDFGTAMIFFVTFLIISFLRSGDFARLVLVVGAAGVMGLMVLRFKPYIADRFATWGHAWDDATGTGYQQVQTMTSAASGGLPGLGAGEGNLSDVGAAPTDLGFGMLSEEWGLIIAILAVLCIVTLGVFAVRSIIAGRSTYYSIAACAATSMFIFQTCLNVFGSVDLLPLTGVTFPFVSAGGTSMIASWGLLALLKAADTRQNASFAIRLDKKGDFDNEVMSGGNLQNPEDIIGSVGIGAGSAASPAKPKPSKQSPTFFSGQSDREKSGRLRRRRKDAAPCDEQSLRNETQVLYSEPIDPNNEDPWALSDTKKKNREKPERAARSRRSDAAPYSEENRHTSRSERSERTASRGSDSRRSGSGRPAAVNYKNISDDDFFHNLEQIRPEPSFIDHHEQNAPRPSKKRETTGRSSSGSASKSNARSTDTRSTSRQSSRPAQKPASGRKQQQEQPLTLEDIFGGDDK